MKKANSKRGFTVSLRLVSCLTVAFFISSLIFPPESIAQNLLNLPRPGVRVPLSPDFDPALLKGIKIDLENPLQFDFLVDKGAADFSETELQLESAKLIKYFLAGLTVPEDELWVNLSPYEEERIIPQQFGYTEMGRDLLAQDYILKQVTSSLMYPEEDLGKRFWQRVYKKAIQKYGSADIPVNTFNKVWILPEKAVVHTNGDIAYVIESRLKVMLEQDYLSLQGHKGVSQDGTDQVSREIIREVLLPELEREVNTGKNFTQLRQIYHAMILATWFKKNLRESFLGRVYVGKNKVAGVDIEDKDAKEKIYQRYLEAFKQGVYNYIKEEQDPVSRQLIPRKYFSGGTHLRIDKAVFAERNNFESADAAQAQMSDDLLVTVRMVAPSKGSDQAMLSDKQLFDAFIRETTGVIDVILHGTGLSSFQDMVDQEQIIEYLKRNFEELKKDIVNYRDNLPADEAQRNYTRIFSELKNNINDKMNKIRISIMRRSLDDSIKEILQSNIFMPVIAKTNDDKYADFQRNALITQLTREYSKRLDNFDIFLLPSFIDVIGRPLAEEVRRIHESFKQRLAAVMNASSELSVMPDSVLGKLVTLRIVTEDTLNSIIDLLEERKIEIESQTRNEVDSLYHKNVLATAFDTVNALAGLFAEKQFQPLLGGRQREKTITTRSFLEQIGGIFHGLKNSLLGLSAALDYLNVSLQDADLAAIIHQINFVGGSLKNVLNGQIGPAIKGEHAPGASSNLYRIEYYDAIIENSRNIIDDEIKKLIPLLRFYSEAGKITEENFEGVIKRIEIINEQFFIEWTDEMKLQEVALNQVIEKALFDLPQSGRYTISWENRGQEYRLAADNNKIYRALKNIINNAAEAMEGIREGGELTIAIQDDGDYITARISDTGIGIAQPQLSKIFDPVFRTTKKEGSGLGLYETKLIVEKHLGTINIESHLGRGTTVTIRLPKSGPKDAAMMGALTKDTVLHFARMSFPDGWVFSADALAYNIVKTFPVGLQDAQKHVALYLADLQKEGVVFSVNGGYSLENNLGGIDLSPDNFNLQTSGTALDFNPSENPALWDTLDIPGFMPVIIHMAPVANVPLLLGLNEPLKRSEFSAL